jgi:hypothetical protein
MKKCYILTFIIITSISALSQFSISTGYALGLPKQALNENINALHSISLGGTYKLPGKLSRVQIGVDMSWGTYASNSKEQTFTFSNGYSTSTNVNYGSNVILANAATKIMLLENKLLLPYVSGKAGYASFYSNIYIEDPNDPLGCRALDQQTLIKDGAFTTCLGGGIQIDWSIFNKKNTKGRHWIDISVNTINGGTVDYINTKKLYDSNNPPTNTDGKPLNVKFINATTNEIHEHQIAEVFSTPIKMLEFKIAAVFALN